MANFKVDVLIKTIEDLQKEKSKNEQILVKECTKRKKLEKTAEALMSALAQASDRNIKMKAELKLEEQGQEQTQKQIDRIEEINDDIRQRIEHLNKQIQGVEDKRREEQETFEHRLSELTDKFRSGWNIMIWDPSENLKEEFKLYKHIPKKEGSSHEEATNCEDEIKGIQERTKTKQENLKSLMEELKEAQSSEFTMPGGIPNHTWESICALFENEKKASELALQTLHKERCLETLEDELTQLKESKNNSISLMTSTSVD